LLCLDRGCLAPSLTILTNRDMLDLDKTVCKVSGFRAEFWNDALVTGIAVDELGSSTGGSLVVVPESAAGDSPQGFLIFSFAVFRDILAA